MAQAREGKIERLYASSLKDIASGKKVQMPVKVLKDFVSGRFSADEIDELVIPHRTLARRVARKEALTQEETDKALRLARILREADRVFASSEKADSWLRAPLRKFSNQSPLKLLKSEAGAFLVEETLGQIDHGFFA